jgi:hypothetical protein
MTKGLMPLFDLLPDQDAATADGQLFQGLRTAGYVARK